MIIVQLKGGLGNQLFQYAAGLSLSRHYHVPVKVDIKELRQHDKEIGTFRNFELQHLISPPVVASQEEIDNVIGKNVLTRYFQKLLPSWQRKIYNEKQFQFDENFLKAGNNIYLKGYRQSERYFLPVTDEVVTTFQFKPGLTANVAPLAGRLENRDSISMHIRRGDYTDTALMNYHGTASADYYQQAIYEIKKSIKNPCFYIFSDNIEWVKQHVQFDNEVEYISGNLSKSHYEDFYLMSRCKHNIIANSSFSWWAAWLNRNGGKIVIAPKKWFNKAPHDTRDLLPTSWIKL